MSATGSLKLLHNCAGVPPFLSPVLVLCVFIYAYMHAHIYTYMNQKITQGPCGGWPLGCDWLVTGYLCPLWGRAAGGRVSPAARELGWRQSQLRLGDVGGLLGEHRNKPFLCVCWHVSDPRPLLNITLSLLFIPAHYKLLPSLKSCIYERFSGGNLLGPFTAKVIEISVTSAHNMPYMLNISFIINIRCRLSTVTVILKYPTLNSECLTNWGQALKIKAWRREALLVNRSALWEGKQEIFILISPLFRQR